MKLIVVARRDLKLGAGKLAAQVGHAAVSCALRVEREAPAAFRKWMEQGQMKVVLRVDGLDEIKRLKGAADDLGVVAVLIQDAGHTQVDPGTTTVLGLGPTRADVLAKLTGHLQLY